MDKGDLLDLIVWDEDGDKDKLDLEVFEVLENESEVKRMDIKDFKQLAKDKGLISEEEVDGEELEDDILGEFRVVDE